MIAVPILFFYGSALNIGVILGEFANARSARKREQNESQRSKFIGAPSRNKFRVPQEGKKVTKNLKTFFNLIWVNEIFRYA